MSANDVEAGKIRLPERWAVLEQALQMDAVAGKHGIREDIASLGEVHRDRDSEDTRSRNPRVRPTE